MSIHAAVSVNSSIKRPIRPRSCAARSRSGSVIPFLLMLSASPLCGEKRQRLPLLPYTHFFLSFLDDRSLLLAQGAHHGRSQIQVRLHQFRWG